MCFVFVFCAGSMICEVVCTDAAYNVCGFIARLFLGIICTTNVLFMLPVMRSRCNGIAI